MQTIKTVEVNQAGYDGLQFVVDKLNRRAERYGMNAVVVRVVREWTEDTDSDGNPQVPAPRYLVEINGHAPRIDGWALAARIENNDLIGTVVRVVPGPYADCDYSAYREHDYSCDHCNTRRRRNDVFVLRHHDGRTKVVGRNCLADFIRSGDAGWFADYAEWCDIVAGWDCETLEECAYENGYANGRPVESLERFLTATAMVTRRMGWVSRSAAYDDPGLVATVDNVNRYLYGRGIRHRDWIGYNELYLDDKDTDCAAKAIEWAKSLESGKSEYLETIRKIATVGLVEDRLAGYAGSIIRAYQRHCERQAERAEKAATAKPKDYIGSERQRLRDLVVTVKGIHYIDGYYGVRTIVRMEAELPENRVAPIVWFASGEKDFDVDSNYTMTATIKEHNDHERYGKQTIVTRAKLTSREKVVA